MRPIGIVDGAPAYNPGNYTQLSPGNFDTGEAQMGGQIVLHNVSPYDLLVWFDDQVQAQYTLHAWQPRQWNFCGVQRRQIYFYPAFTPPADMINNAPASYLWGESYQTGEDVPQFFPADARINAVGNTISTKGTSNVLNNDGNTPATQFIESTPSDQASSSISDNNDGSGFRKILSANVLRTVWNIIRGDSGATKAQIQFGDSGDNSITTYYGTWAGSMVPSADNIGQQLSATDTGASPTNKPALKTNQTAGSTYDFYIMVWDGATPHTSLIVDHTGLRYSDAAGLGPGTIPVGVVIPAAQVGVAQPDVMNLSDALNITLSSLKNAFIAYLPSAPVSDQNVFSAKVTGDGPNRLNQYIGASGYGGFSAGPGGSTNATAHLDSVAKGWSARENFAFLANNGIWLAGYAIDTVPPNSTAYLGSGHIIGTETDVSLVSVGQALSSIADWTNGYVLKINNYYDGTNDRFIAAKSALQIIFKTDQAVAGPSIQWRWNNGTPVAGGVITWYATQGIPFFDVYGTIDQGQRIWKGSGDPASGGRVVEGDLWVPA